MQNALLDALYLSCDGSWPILLKNANEKNANDSEIEPRMGTAIYELQSEDDPVPIDSLVQELECKLPRTPPPKRSQPVDSELTPGNIGQLGLDVSLSPRAGKTQSRYRDSLYTQAFETVLNTVLEHESNLFSPQELQVFECYRQASYESRYLYVRLFLRKRAAWFRVNSIGYESDISNVTQACQELFNSEYVLAENEACISDLEEYVNLLSLEELKTLAKEFGCKGTTKQRLSHSLLTLSKYQTGLQRTGSLGLDVGTGGKLEKRGSAVLLKVKSLLGPMIRLRSEPVSFFHRLHIVFYRSSEYNEKSLTTLILSRISRRNFPAYIVDRCSDIFNDRQSLLDYEAALILKFEVDEIMEFRTTEAGMVRVMEIFDDIYEPWQALVLAMQEQASQSCNTGSLHSQYYSRRFTAGWIWTKIIYQAATILGRRHEYRMEHEVWKTLLSQKVFRVGKRGEWYDRKALIEQHYSAAYLGSSTLAEKRRSKQVALQTCIMGLQDPDTHQIFHNALQRRIVRLEADLNLIKRERHDFTHILLRKPRERTICGVRLDDRVTGKHSIWRGSSSTDAEVGVEELCLEQYAREGWQGFHSENSIITTLFAMLFWDILFLSIPGVFQTAFQTAPLDLATDAFYPARASEINHRLAYIENGGYRDLINTIDAAHRERETWCIGMRWTYSKVDLIEIADCLGGRALSQLCRLFAEEYGHRVGGIGDLCLWKADQGKCMFVEVKGPGDRLSETQIAWLDQMALAGIDIELCHVCEVATISLDDVAKIKKQRKH